MPRLGAPMPTGPAAAVPIETAQMKVRIRKNLPAELYFDFMAYATPEMSSLASAAFVNVSSDRHQVYAPAEDFPSQVTVLPILIAIRSLAITNGPLYSLRTASPSPSSSL